MRDRLIGVNSAPHGRWWRGGGTLQGMTDAPDSVARGFAGTQRAMTLGTADPGPWAAPVYYLFRDGRFYFFSSASSRHVESALRSGVCAAAVFRDADDWREIEGLQMEGSVVEIMPGDGAAQVFGAYVERFPSVISFFDGAFGLEEFQDRFRSRLYAFVPSRVLYTNNRDGFGRRIEVQLSAR